MTKFIFVTGGVLSGLGKGITAASLGRLLKLRGLKVAAQKMDPYLNVDPGTMSPFQHGEVFVTDDGAETDLDLGHYERFIDEDLNKLSSLTAGRVYWNVLSRERTGGYLGETVQIIPHITNEIKSYVYGVAEKTGADVVITEIGGTTGDIESQPFIEAIRQVAQETGRRSCLFIHVTLVPYVHSSGEHKSKPTQHSVRELQGMGIAPDIIVARSESALPDSVKQKISLFCNVPPECVIDNTTLPTLYAVPSMLEEQHMSQIVCEKLGIKAPDLNWTEWSGMLERLDDAKAPVTVALVGKYTQLHDAYLSVVESLSHAGYENAAKVTLKWVDAEKLNDDTAEELLSDVSGVIVPGGFGDRGISGMIAAAKYARENKVPYLGLCLGMQIAVIEYARDVLGWKDADSREFNPECGHCVIDLMPDQQGNIPKGGTMRLGAYPCRIAEGTRLAAMYGAYEISERHRHRYEFNNAYRAEFEAAGLIIAGASPDGRLVEAVELKGHPFFTAVQFHPEFKSRPNRAHPLFREFIAAALANKG